MRAIRHKDTTPELAVRKGLHSAGFRYRLHRKDLPGRPDIVLPKYRAVIFIHGCFWHGHGCHLFKVPQTRPEFWIAKINANKVRDINDASMLRAAGWRILTIWECALKGKKRLSFENLLEDIRSWLLYGGASAVIDSNGLTRN